jgi:hypothetical protein
MQLQFDATNIQPFEQGGVCFPLNDYPFEIVKAELEPVKGKPNCGMLVVDLKVMDGQYKGMVQKDRFNLYNDNPKAVEIAQRQLSSLCHSIKRLQIQDTTHLIGGRGIATIGPQDDNDKYSEVKAYKDVEGRVNGKGEPMPAPTPVDAPAQAQQAPWSAQGTQAPAQATQPPANAAWGSAAPAPASGSAAPPWATTGISAPAPAASGNKPPWAQ